MNSTFKPRLELLEVREVPALFGLVPSLMLVVTPPTDPTNPPPPVSPPPSDNPGPIGTPPPAPEPWFPAW